MPRLKLIAAALLAGLTLGGCSMLTPQTSTDSAVPLVVVVASGGHCMEGQCEATTTILRDGTLTIDGGPEPVVVHVDSSLVAPLTAAVDAADYATITSVPFTGECPIAFDGQELTYTFRPVGRDAVTFSSCEVEIPVNHPLFRALEAVMIQTTEYRSGRVSAHRTRSPASRPRGRLRAPFRVP